MRHIKRINEMNGNIDLKELCQFYMDNCEDLIDKYKNQRVGCDMSSYDDLVYVKTRCRAESLDLDWNTRKEWKDKIIDFLIDFKSKYPNLDTIDVTKLK